MNSRLLTGLLLVTCSCSSVVHAQSVPDLAARVVLDHSGDPSSINATGRAAVLTVPVMDGSAYLGDMTLTLQTNGDADFSAARLLSLLESRLSSAALAQLRTSLNEKSQLARADLAVVGLRIAYDPQTLQLNIDLDPSARASQAVTLREDERGPISYIQPANFSAYLNIRGSMDWVQQGSDEGLSAPITYLDGAIRAAGFVLEGEANWQAGAAGADFVRRGSRVVYDDRSNLVRWTGGDLRTLARGFQSAPEISGLSVSRIYSLLDPQRIIRPRGTRSFQLERRSVVEVRVNGQLVKRMEMDPGNFDLKDFPFTQGSNDVRLTITDDSGRTQSFNFGIFLDQSQLAEGLSEFGLYAGVKSPLGRSGPVYSDDWAFSGFYRRGLKDWLTVGVNAQGDKSDWMGGVETVVATPFGAIGALFSASHADGVGKGWASIMTFQRTITRANDTADALSFSLETRSRNFAPIAVGMPRNPYAYAAGVTYNRSINSSLYAGLDARYSRGRDAEPHVKSLRATGGWNMSPRLNLTADVSYERYDQRDRVGAFLSLIFRLDGRSSLRGDYDSRGNRSRLGYQKYSGSGTGSYNFSADLERSDLGYGTSANGNFYSNRAELGFSHFGTYARGLSASTTQRSSLRFGTAFAVADGQFSIGRPIQDSFAIVHGHKALKGADLLVDSSATFSAANSGVLGTALQSSLGSYNVRTISVAAPDAPLGTDLGSGTFRMLPMYRTGYKLQVGSDYMISMVGRLLGKDGQPIALVAGRAVELKRPDRDGVPLFTNAAGRFGVTGLAPGPWRIILEDPDQTVFDIVINDGDSGTITAQDLHPNTK